VGDRSSGLVKVKGFFGGMNAHVSEEGIVVWIGLHCNIIIA
jgi:hypothetical protein